MNTEIDNKLYKFIEIGQEVFYDNKGNKIITHEMIPVTYEEFDEFINKINKGGENNDK